MHRNRSRALHGDAAIDGDARPAGDGEVDFLRRSKVDVLRGGDQFHVLPGQELHLVALCLQVDVVPGGDQFETGVAVARLDRAGEQADGLAAVDSRPAGDGEIAVLAAGESQGFTSGVLQILAGDMRDAGLAGLDDGWVGQVRQFALAGGGILLLGVVYRSTFMVRIDHAAGDDLQCLERCRLVVDDALVAAGAANRAGQLDGLVGGRRLRQAAGRHIDLLDQRYIASAGIRRGRPGGHRHAAPKPDAATGLAGFQGEPVTKSQVRRSTSNLGEK